MDRKTAILRSANEHFASHGFRGASLRDIARDAQVSLTLLNHHFGSKLDLLRAVIKAHSDVLDACVVRSRELMAAGGPVSLEAVLGVWVDIVLERSKDTDGRHFLRLLGRMADDAEVEASAVVQGGVQDAARVLMDAIRHAYPAATKRHAAIGYLAVTTAMIRCVTQATRIGQLETIDDPVPPPPPPAEDGTPAAPPPPREWPPVERDLLLRFLAGGVRAMVEG